MQCPSVDFDRSCARDLQFGQLLTKPGFFFVQTIHEPRIRSRTWSRILFGSSVGQAAHLGAAANREPAAWLSAARRVPAARATGQLPAAGQLSAARQLSATGRLRPARSGLSGRVRATAKRLRTATNDGDAAAANHHDERARGAADRHQQQQQQLGGSGRRRQYYRGGEAAGESLLPLLPLLSVRRAVDAVLDLRVPGAVLSTPVWLTIES